jgi:uncharacterized protein (UPF0332 family)
MATPEQRQILIDAHLAQAEKRLAAARSLLATGAWEDAVSRAYYAAFHAVTAALAGRELEAKTHNGARTLFILHFIHGGELPAELGRSLDMLFRARQSSDYDPSPLLGREDAELSVSQADAIVRAIRGHLGR